MECTVPLTVRIATDHADVGSLERTVTDALGEVGRALRVELIGRLDAAIPRPVGCRRAAGGWSPMAVRRDAWSRSPARWSCAADASGVPNAAPRWSRSTRRSAWNPGSSTPSASGSAACGWPPR